MPSPKLVPLVLSDAQRASLDALSRKRTASQALAERARVVLACAEEGGVAPLTRVAARTTLSRESVRKWRVRFIEGRMDTPRRTSRGPGQRATSLTSRWKRWSRARSPSGAEGSTVTGRPGPWPQRPGLSQSSVSRIWRAFGLKPHAVETWKLSTDPEFIGKVRNVVGLYMSPPEHALVLAVDEKSQIQALDRTAPCLPMLPDDAGTA